jgi:hypothetical protein
MGPLIRKRLAEALKKAASRFVEVLASDVLAASAARPADAVTERLTQACAGVVPSRPGRQRDEQPEQRVWLPVADVEHLLAEAPAAPEAQAVAAPATEQKPSPDPKGAPP